MWYNGGMAHDTHTRRALLLPMQVAETCIAPLWEALLAQTCGAYATVWALEPGAVLAGGARPWRRLQSASRAAHTRRIAAARETLQELHTAGAGLAARLARVPTDVFVCGGADALRSAARMALWTRHAAPATRWIGVPCCPYNSVPFTLCSAGYASALRYCARVALERTRTTLSSTITVAGDAAGWLALGVAAVAPVPDGGGAAPAAIDLAHGAHDMPCTAFERRFGRALGRAAVKLARHAAPGVMVAARRALGRALPVFEHLGLTESMYAPRAVPSHYCSLLTGRPTPAMREFALALCTPWPPRRSLRHADV